MGLFFVYILKSAVCLALFYLFYRLLLSRETFHRFNRCMLLGILLLSCLLPLVEVSVDRQTEAGQTMLSLEQLLLLADAPAQAEAEAAVEADPAVAWVQVLLLLYLGGIFFFVLRNLYSLTHLLALLRSGTREEMASYLPGVRGGKVRLIVHQRAIAPFSWLKYIVIARKDLEENGREILLHECAHIRGRHSLDLLLADLCIFLQWFNPASWLLKQELQNIHEYEADETVLEEGVDARQYQLLLIRKAVGTRLYSMANSFNHSKLKKRITMMLKKKSSRWACLKCLYVFPLAALAVTAFARPEISETTEEISAAKVNDLVAIVETKVTESIKTPLPVIEKRKQAAVADTSTSARPVAQDDRKVYDAVEQVPRFPGGMPALMDYLRQNMRYPESARRVGMQGRVTVQFVVTAEGKVVSPVVARPVEAELDAEALRLVSSMPRWEPGRQDGKPVAVKFTVPVTFNLEDIPKGGTDQPEASAMNRSEEVPDSLLAGVDIYVDGKLIDLGGKRLDDLLPAGEIREVLIKKQPGGRRELRIQTKKWAASAEAEGDVVVKGHVIDEEGQPVPGAIISVEGTELGSVADMDGNFMLRLAPDEATLCVSFIGMETARVKAQPEMTITLKKE